MTSKKRQTIMANPLDDIEMVVRPLKKRAISTKIDQKPKSKRIKNQKTSVTSRSKSSKNFTEDNVLDVAEKSIQHVPLISGKEDPSSNASQKLTAEEIFLEESNSRNLVIVQNLPSDLRLKKANKCVILWSWVSVPTALIPFIALDVAATIAIQVKMIRDICHIYGVPFRNENARAFISGLVGGGIATLASSGLKNLLLKSLPHVGSTVAFLAQPALGFSTTYALGQVFIRHLENDGLLTDFDSDKMREVFREQLNRGKSLFKRGRQELNSHMDT